MTLAALLPALDRFLEAAAISRMDRVLVPIERKAERRIAAAFTLQGRVFLEAFTASRRYFAEADPPPGWEAAAAQSEVVSQANMTEALREVSEDALLAGLTDAAVAHGLIPPGTRPFGIGAASLPPHIAGLFNLANPRAVAYMAQHGAALVAGINETTRAQLRTLLTEAMAKGWSYDRTAREIRAKFAGFAGKASQSYIRSRAHLVAVTESASAYVEGNMQVARSLRDVGLEMEKQWLASGGACPICESNASQGWIGIDDVFVEGDDAAPAHPGCRCDILTRRVES